MNANDRIIWMNCYYAALTGLCVNWGSSPSDRITDVTQSAKAMADGALKEIREGLKETK